MSKRNIILTVGLAVVVVVIAAAVYFTVDFGGEPKSSESTEEHKYKDDEPQTSETTATFEAVEVLELELDPSLELQIREDYYNRIITNFSEPSECSLSDISVSYYYGSYDGYEVVIMESPLDFDKSDSSADVAGYKIISFSGQEAWLYKDTQFYTVFNAYELGLITKGGVYEIGKKINPSFEMDCLDPPEDYYGYSENSKKSEPSFILKIREDYYNKVVSEYPEPSKYNLSNIYIRKYFGNYSGCDVMYMSHPSLFDTDKGHYVEVAGYAVFFPRGDEVWVYKNSEFYTLLDAYEAGLITVEDVYEIGKKLDYSFEKDYPYSPNVDENDIWKIKVETELLEIMEEKSDNDIINIYLWLVDIDQEVIRNALIEEKSINPEIYENEDIYNATPDADMDDYIMAWREITKRLHSAANNAFIEQYVRDDREILYNSEYTSTIIVEATKSEIIEYAKNDAVEEISFYYDSPDIAAG